MRGVVLGHVGHWQKFRFCFLQHALLNKNRFFYSEMDKIGKARPTNKSCTFYGSTKSFGQCAWCCLCRVEVAHLQLGGHVGAREVLWESVMAHEGLGLRVWEMS